MTKEPEQGAYTLKGIDPALWRRVKAAAALEGMTISEWILKTLAGKLGKGGDRR